MSLLFSIYFSSVLFTGLLTSTCLAHKPAYQLLTTSLISRSRLSLLSSIVTEYSIFILLAKMFFIYEISGPGFFVPFVSATLYKFDLAIMLTLWALFLKSVFSRHPIYEATKFLRNPASTSPPSIFTYSFWFRFSNPFWSSRSLLIHESISYATPEEQDQEDAHLMTLDVFQHPSFPRDCPVVVSLG